MMPFPPSLSFPPTFTISSAQIWAISGFLPEPAENMDDQHVQISISMVSNPRGRLGKFYFTTTP